MVRGVASPYGGSFLPSGYTRPTTPTSTWQTPQGQGGGRGFSPPPGATNLAGRFLPHEFNTGVSNTINPLKNLVGIETPIGPPVAPTTLAGVGQAVSGAGVGYLVGSFNPLAKHQEGSQVGGTIGGAVGTFLPIPGGTLIGSFIGSTLGGMFGSRPHPTSQFVSDIGAGGTLENIEFGSKHIDDNYAKQTSTELGNFLKLTTSATGIDLSGVSVFGGTNDGRTFIRTNRGGKLINDFSGFEGDKVFQFDANNEEDKIRAFKEFTKEALKEKGQLNEQTAAAIDGFNVTQAISNVNEIQTTNTPRDRQGIPLVGPTASFKEYVKSRQGQGSNVGVAAIQMVGV